MRRLHFTLAAVLVAALAFADAPNGSGTYYSAANGKKAAALKTALCAVVYNRTELSYDALWEAFKTTDKRSDGKVWDMYSDNTNFTFDTDKAGNYSREGDVYNREHSFPKSWFGGAVMPMYTDLHHMYPTDGYVNNYRGAYPFGTTKGEVYSSHGGFSKLGACTQSGYTGRVFEPADEYKGDFARTYFYMVTCYEEKLADWVKKNSSTDVVNVLDGTTYPGLKTWQLNMLLAWAAADPVSQKEVNRNNAVYGIQGNRNPFIDYPGLEQYIWGSKTSDAFSYDNYVVPEDYDSGNTGGNTGGDSGNTGGDSGTTDGADVINLAFTGVSDGSTTYTDWSNKKGSSSSAVYAGQSAGGNSSIQIRSNNSNSGIITTTSGGTVSKVSVNWESHTSSGRTLNVYGKNTAYTAVTDLYDSSKQGTLLGTIVCGTSTELTISGSYAYVGFRSASGAMYLTEIDITWNGGGSTATPSEPMTFSQATTVGYGVPFTLTRGTDFITDGAVTLSSSNDAVATVSGLTVTPVAVGSCVINAVYEATDNYKAGSSTFVFTVTQPEGKTVAAPSAETVFTETFKESTGNTGWGGTAANGTLVFDNSGWAKFYGYGNGGSARIGKGEGLGYVITPALGVAGDLTLTFKSGAWNGDKTTEALILSVDAGGGTLSTTTFDLSSGSWTEYSTTIIGATAGTKIKFSAVQSSKNRFFLDDVVVAKAGVTITVKLNDSGYATFCSEYPLDFSDYETADYSAWQVTGVTGTVIAFSQITGAVKGGTGVLLKGMPGETITLKSSDSETEAEGNHLYGTLAPTYVDAEEYYGLSDDTFKRVAAGTVKAHKALLPASVVNAAGVKALVFEFDDDITSIGEELREESSTGAGAVYNLAGQRVEASRLVRGIYIRDGRKMFQR